MHRLVLTCIAAMLLPVLVFACADDEQLRQQIAELQRQVNDLQTTIADQNLRMEEMNSSLFVLRESAKDNREAIKKLQQEMRQPTVYIQQPQPTQTVVQSETPTPFSPTPQEATAPQPLPQGTNVAPTGDDDAFRQATAQLEQGNWGLAIYDLNAFITQHPGSAYVPRARYALGDAYRNLSEYAQAIREYERCLAAGREAGPYAPRSLSWIMRCHERLGQTEKAKQARERLLREYPDSPEAKKLQMESSP